MKWKYGKRSKDNLKNIHPRLVEFAEELLKISPYDITVTQGLRTAEYQYSLYKQGRYTKEELDSMKKKGIKPNMKKVTPLDGYKRKSNHQMKSDGYGHAIDIGLWISGKIDYTEKYYIELGKLTAPLLKKYNIIWGGNWKKKDLPHFELGK